MDAPRLSRSGPAGLRRHKWGRTLRHDADLPTDLVDTFLQGREDHLVTSSARLQVKDRTVVVRVEHHDASYTLKRHTWGGPWRTLRMMHRTPAARRCAALGHFLAENGIPTPRVRADLSLGIGPFCYRSYILADYVPGRSLFEVIRYEPLSDDELRSLAAQTAEVWRTLIALNVSHNDLKPENFIIDPRHKLWLIDFEKLRFHRSAQCKKLRSKHLQDARIFLHPRNWRGREAAAEVFRRALLSTPLAGWAAEAGHAACFLLRPAPIDVGARAGQLSAAIVVDPGRPDLHNAERTARSVRSIADETAFVSIQQGEAVRCTNDLRATGEPWSPRNEWTLLLRAGEAPTPDLLRELPELLVDRPNLDAVRVPVDAIYFGCSTRPDGETATAPVRAFRWGVHSGLADGEELDARMDSPRIALIARKINRPVYSEWSELLHDLDERSLMNALARFDRGERPRVFTDGVKAAFAFARHCLSRDVRRGGSLAAQIGAARSFFAWMEGVRLWQLTRRFHHEASPIRPAAAPPVSISGTATRGRTAA